MTIIRHDFQKGKQTEVKKTDDKNKIPAYRIRMELSFSSPRIWRVVEVPGSLSLGKLHTVVQSCFGWDDEAAHRFLVGKIFYSPGPGDEEKGVISEVDVQLHEIEESMGFVFTYLYDRGGGWECELTLQQVLPDASALPSPVLVDGERADPPAGFDDIHEYQQLLADIERADEDKPGLLAAHGLESGFDPEIFDSEPVKVRLSDIS